MTRLKININVFILTLALVVTAVLCVPYNVRASGTVTFKIIYKTGSYSTSSEKYVLSEFNPDITCYCGIGYNKLVPCIIVSTQPFKGQRNDRYTLTSEFDDTYNLYYYFNQPTGYYSGSSNIVSTENAIYDSTIRYNDNYSLRYQAFDRFLQLHPIEEPSTEEPSTEEPSTEEPSTEEPSTEEPSTEEPSTEEPSTEEPSTEEPSTEEPSTEEPSTEEPSTEEPSTEEPSTEEPSTGNYSDLSQSVTDNVDSYLTIFLQIPFLSGFAFATLLSLLCYGVFKALSLINIYRH